MTKKEFEAKLKDVLVTAASREYRYKCPTTGCPIVVITTVLTWSVRGEQPCAICREETRRQEALKRKVERCN